MTPPLAKNLAMAALISSLVACRIIGTFFLRGSPCAYRWHFVHFTAEFVASFGVPRNSAWHIGLDAPSIIA